MMIAVVDYGMGNLRSVSKALEHVAPDTEVSVTSNPDDLYAADRVVFPGQGAMPDCMREVDARGLRSAVVAAAQEKPFLGICIGLQMLFERSEEGDTAGLGILPGLVRRFPDERMQDERGFRLKVPHMGWNNVHQTEAHAVWDGLEDGERFYFVHSYFPEAGTPDLVAGFSVPGIPVTCAVARDKFCAVPGHGG
jgi:glutamine amidotransferase